ncbi:MAG: ATP-binding protein [Microcella pacifica]
MIDFSEVPSDVLPVVVGVLARVLYEIHFWTEADERTPVTIVCDEAHLYLPSAGANVVEQRALDTFEKIAKEGRKYGMSLLVVSQRPSDVSRTVLSQCNNFIALRLTNDQDQLVVRRLMPDNMMSLTSGLPLLDVGEAIILGDAIILPTRVRLDIPKIKPASATMNFWTEWNEREVSDESVVAAVESMRRQSRR